MRSHRDIDRLILELAAEQESVIHSADLRRADISPSMLGRRIDAALMAPIVPRTYGVGPLCGAPTTQMKCMAAALQPGKRGLVDGPTAAMLLDAWDRWDGIVHVTVAGGIPSRQADWIRFHRAPASWKPVRCLKVGSIPLPDFLHICARAAQSLDKWQVAFIINRGIYLGFVILEALVLFVERRERAPGNGVLRAAVKLVAENCSGTRSRTEDAILRDLLGAGMEEPVVNTRGCMGLYRDEPDFVWRGRLCNIEVDGGHHDQPGQARDDQVRDAHASALGWKVLRVRPRDYWRNPRRTVARMLRFLGAG